nr:uncharacterized protein LOC129256025 [Lytechinus pictus]
MKKNTSATMVTLHAERKIPVDPKKPALHKKPPKHIIQAPPPKPCNKPRNDSDDESDDEDQYGYIQPEAQAGDIANLIRQAGRLPICVKVQSNPPIKDCDCRGGDILMLHCTDKERLVKAVEPNGNTFYLPVHSNQLYEILPLDPKLDGKIYRGTMELVKADPLPQIVRVLIGYFDEAEEDDTKEQNDIITIEGVSKEADNETYLIGEIMGEPQRFRAMKDEAVYTTQIFPEQLAMHDIVIRFKDKLPVRVRTANPLTSSRGRQKELEFRLEAFVPRERVIATRARGEVVIAFPYSAPLKLDLITPPWSILPSLMAPLYGLLNTSMCKKGLSEVRYPRKAMKAVSQPKKEVLDEWLQSPEGKIKINEIAEEENADMQKKMIALKADLKRAETELSFLKSQRPPPPMPLSPSHRGPLSSTPTLLQTPPILPQRSPNRPSTLPGLSPHAPSTIVGSTSSLSSLEPPLPARPSSRSRSSSLDENEYDDLVIKNSPSNVTIGLASTDLEKELKNLLGEKVAEIQSKDKEYQSLQEQHKRLLSKIDEQTGTILKLEEELDELKDQEDCYDLMIPNSNKQSNATNNKEHQVLPKQSPVERRPEREKTLKSPKTTLPSAPVSPGIPTLRRESNTPLPSVPTNQAPSSLLRGSRPKHPREEYEPIPLSMISGKDDLSSRPRLKSPQKKPGSARYPLPTEPLQPPQILRTSDITSLPLSQQTDSFKRSLTARPSDIESVHRMIKIPVPPNGEYDLPDSDSPPPLPPPPPPTLRAGRLPSSRTKKQSLDEPLSPNHPFDPVLYDTPNTELNSLSKEMVSILLRSINLDDCVDRFLQESVDGILLMSIDEEMMMNELGMTSFQARKLTIKIDELSRTNSGTRRDL